MSTAIWNPSHEALLRRKYFDWSEDVEDSIQMPENEQTVQYPDDDELEDDYSTSEHHNMIQNPEEILSADMIDAGSNDAAENTEDEITQFSQDSIFDKDNDFQDYNTTESDEAPPFNNEAVCVRNSEIYLDHVETPEVTGQSHTCPENDVCLYCVDRVIDTEFAWRQFCQERDQEIHHYNLFGQPVYEPSGTSPSESLAVILSPKQLFPDPEDHHITSVLNRPRVFLDPVCVDVTQSNLHLRGSKLMKSVRGKAYKCYSPHGTWQWEAEGQDIVYAPDDARSYCLPETAVAAGFLETMHIRAQKEVNGRDVTLTLPQPSSLPQKLSWNPSPSPLSKCHLEARAEVLDPPKPVAEDEGLSSEVQISTLDPVHASGILAVVKTKSAAQRKSRPIRAVLPNHSDEKRDELRLSFFPPFIDPDIKISKRARVGEKIKKWVDKSFRRFWEGKCEG
ncbi:hypothetical protein N7488_005137 [Penicillium malachiteum]|nr:hypothetical protein N7488_005137 [Penicillium malachiteum]